MRTRTVRAGAALVLTAGLVAGCESSPRRMPYNDNPLLQARQPLLQPQPVPGADPQSQVAQNGPRMVVVPPPGQYPGTAVAARTAADAPYAPAVPKYTPPPQPTPPAPPAVPPHVQMPMADPGLPTLPPAPAAAMAPMMTPPAAMPLAPMPAPMPPAAPEVTPASAQAPAPAAPPVTQAVVRMVEGKYGHSPDHAWLQGELDRHYRGYLELRFRSASEDDPLGGKVRLEEDPRLADFRPGDVIAVEGELLTDPDGSAPSWSQYRRFHVRAARLVERK
jgi:hypothetical protein